MVRNYFKIAWRNFWKNKTFSFLNVFGLAIGITCAGLIFLWVQDEVGYDNNHNKKDRLYLVKTNSEVEGGVFTHSSTPGPLGPALQAIIPGIANTCRTTEGQISSLFKMGDKTVYASGKYAEASLFTMFTLPFVQGNPNDAFEHPYSIVITEKTAKKFFDDTKNCVGKTVRMNNEQDYVVTGVLNDLPENSTLQFEWLAPFKVWSEANPWIERWNNFGLSTYIELKPGVDSSVLNSELMNPLYDFTTQRKESSASTVHVFLFGMEDWHLYDAFENGKATGDGRIKYVRLFSIIAWIILIIACINFMNLATASSEKRSKEIGVRKALGSGKTSLVLQFMTEALFMALLAGVAAVFIMAIILPKFNDLVQKNLSLGLTDPFHIAALSILILICGLLAGSYPSLYLSSFDPVFVLKGMKLKTGSALIIRKGLVVAQFAVSIMLIIATITIYLQIQHVKSRDLGYNKNNLIQVDAQKELVEHFSSVKQDLISTGVVSNMALADHETISDGNNTTSITWQGKDPNSNIVISQRLVSAEFMSTTGMHLIEGRDFNPTDAVEFGADRRPKDSTQVFNVVITESMQHLLGKGSAIGKTMQHHTDIGTFHMRVVGVIKDYVYGNMYGQSPPVVFYNMPQAANLLYIRTKPQIALGSALAKIGIVMKKNNPAYPFEYKFVDDQFNEMFLGEMLISRLSLVFATLAIIISCLGLFGLAAYTAEWRRKEIGVRKVLGASVSGIATLLSTDFLKLVGISCIIGFPLAWFAMYNWLQGYEYRIEISGWIFFIAGALALLIALITISFQAIKAAIANPVKSLRTE